MKSLANVSGKGRKPLPDLIMKGDLTMKNTVKIVAFHNSVSDYDICKNLKRKPYAVMKRGLTNTEADALCELLNWKVIIKGEIYNLYIE